MTLCMHPVLTASLAQSVPVSQPGGKVFKSSQTSIARAAGRASAAERPASQALASQGSHRVNRNFSTFSSLTIYSPMSCLQGKGEAPAPRRIAVEVSTAGEGAVIVPEFPEGDQKFLHFLHELLRFAT